MKKEDILSLGPGGKKLDYKEALEGALLRRMWLLEHSQAHLKEGFRLECQQILDLLQEKSKGHSRK